MGIKTATIGWFQTPLLFFICVASILGDFFRHDFDAFFSD